MAALLTSLGISIHAPREGGDIDIPNRHTDDSISIHAPREGGDRAAVQVIQLIHYFNPRPPARGATRTHRPVG